MTIHLSGEREQAVLALMQAGGFASETDVVDEAIKLLEERFEQVKLAELRREIQIGIDQADRGELMPFDPQSTLSRIRARQTNAG